MLGKMSASLQSTQKQPERQPRLAIRAMAALLLCAQLTFSTGMTSLPSPPSAPELPVTTIAAREIAKVQSESTSSARRTLASVRRWISKFFQPSTQTNKPTELRPNDTYLRDYEIGVVGRNADSFLLEHRRAKALEQQYQDLNRDYDDRRAFGLSSDVESQTRQNERLRGFSRSVLGQVQQTQVERNSEYAKRAANGIGKTPGTIIGVMFLLTSGTPIQLKLADRWHLVARSNALQQQGGLQIASPLFDSSFDFASRSDANSERYRLSVSRPLLFDVQSGVSYGGTSGTVSASLSRALMSNLSLVLSSQSRVNSATAGDSQQSAQVVYGLQF